VNLNLKRDTGHSFQPDLDQTFETDLDWNWNQDPLTHEKRIGNELNSSKFETEMKRKPQNKRKLKPKQDSNFSRSDNEQKNVEIDDDFSIATPGFDVITHFATTDVSLE